MTEHYKVKLDPDQMGSLIDQLAPDLDEQTEQTATLHEIRDQVRRIADALTECGEDIGDDKPCPCTRRDGHDGDHRCACDDSQTWDAGVDVTEEPPVGSQVTDNDGDVFHRFADGWAMWDVDEWGAPGGHWANIRHMHAPLRLTTDADRERVGLPVDTAPDVDLDEALVDKADEDSTVRPGLYVGGRRVGAAMGPWEWGADGKWHRTSWTPTPVVQWHYTEPDPDEALAMDLYHASMAVPPASEIGPSPYGSDFIHDHWLRVARAARGNIEAEGDSRAAWLMSSRDDALRRAEWAERERDEAYAAREHFSGHIDYWTEQTDEARHRAADAEDDRDTWNRRYVNLLDRIRGRRDIYAHSAQAPIFRAETVADELAALLPDEEDDR